MASVSVLPEHQVLNLWYWSFCVLFSSDIVQNQTCFKFLRCERSLGVNAASQHLIQFPHQVSFSRRGVKSCLIVVWYLLFFINTCAKNIPTSNLNVSGLSFFFKTFTVSNYPADFGTFWRTIRGWHQREERRKRKWKQLVLNTLKATHELHRRKGRRSTLRWIWSNSSSILWATCLSTNKWSRETSGMISYILVYTRKWMIWRLCGHAVDAFIQST